MRKMLQVIMLGVLLIFPITAAAQDPALDINASFSVKGTYDDGRDPYTGIISFSGWGSIYDTRATLSYTDSEINDTMILIGNSFVDAFGEPGCQDTAYSRDADGVLVGMWLDVTNGWGIGMEILTPTGISTDYTGSYTIRGMYPSGGFYTGTADISVDDDGLYTATYSFAHDSGEPVDDVVGMGYATDSILGISVPENSDGNGQCGLLVAQFDDAGNYAGRWYDRGSTGAETGLRR